MKKAHIRKKKLTKKFLFKQVCCCDLQHRVVMSIDEDGLATMDDGYTFDVFMCTTPVTEDGSCHELYLERE